MVVKGRSPTKKKTKEAAPAKVEETVAAPSMEIENAELDEDAYHEPVGDLKI